MRWDSGLQMTAHIIETSHQHSQKWASPGWKRIGACAEGTRRQRSSTGKENRATDVKRFTKNEAKHCVSRTYVRGYLQIHVNGRRTLSRAEPDGGTWQSGALRRSDSAPPTRSSCRRRCSSCGQDRAAESTACLRLEERCCRLRSSRMERCETLQTKCPGCASAAAGTPRRTGSSRTNKTSSKVNHTRWSKLSLWQRWTSTSAATGCKPSRAPRSVARSNVFTSFRTAVTRTPTNCQGCDARGLYSQIFSNLLLHEKKTKRSRKANTKRCQKKN